MAKKAKKTAFKVNGKPLFEVPYGSYDPALEAQRLAARRGLSDLRDDTRTANKWARTDVRTDRRNLAKGWRRDKQDMLRGYRRNQQKLALQRQDLTRDMGRRREDFSTQLAGIGRQFSQLAEKQQEARNAAGTLQGGTGAAAAAKRAENQMLAEQPLRTSQDRAEQDFTTSLNRLGTAENQLTQDFRRGWNRGLVDTRQNLKLTNRSFGRGMFSRDRKLQRGIREQRIGEADILAQKIDSARQRNPGAFTKYGKKKRNR